MFIKQYLRRIITEAVEDALSQANRYNHCGFEMLIGIPGSGKSTYLRTIANPNVIVVCPDNIRKELTGNISDQSRNRDVWSLTDKRIVKNLHDGKYVILDATNVGTRNRVSMLNRLKSIIGGGLKTYATVFEGNPDLSKSRIAKDIKNGVDRSNVPPEIVDRMYEQYLETIKVIENEGFDDVFFI